MKQKLQRLCRIANTAMAAVPSLAGRVRMGLLIAIMIPVGAWAQNSTPTYIASIGVAQDGSSGSTCQMVMDMIILKKSLYLQLTMELL